MQKLLDRCLKASMGKKDYYYLGELRVDIRLDCLNEVLRSLEVWDFKPLGVF